MDTFFKVLFQDPILLAAALVLVAAVLILLWALNAMKKLKGSSFEPSEDEQAEEPETPAPAENTGLFEARLREISNQLAIIAQRLTELEKTVKDRNTAQDQTNPGLAAPAEMEKMVKRVETKLEALAAETANKAGPSGDHLGRLESKLEGIHKLLILLTDSGGPEQK